MAKFTVRVELHQADEDDYEVLHSKMEGRGFSRTIRGGDGICYHLPPAEYNFEGSERSDDVLQLAKDAATATRLKYAVLVTEGIRKWWGLEKV